MRKLLGLGLAAALAAVAAVTSANAAMVLTFDDHLFSGTASGTIAYGGSGAMTGTGIDINGVLSSGTPLNDGVSLRCDGCSLSFTTGANTLESAGVWLFGGGGSFVLTGTMVLPSDNSVHGTGILLSGSFTSAQVGGTASALTFLGFGVDNKNADLLAFYGIGADVPFSFASTEISTNVTSFNSTTFAFEATVTNSDLVNSAPEPGSLALIGAGLAGIGLLRRRRKSAA